MLVIFNGVDGPSN